MPFDSRGTGGQASATALAAMLGAGCGELFAVDGATSASTGTGTEGLTDSSVANADDGPDRHAVDRDFLAPPDGGTGEKLCSPWEQDCSLGEKCTYYDGQGDGWWNATKCVPVAPDPDPVGAACTVVHSPVSGLDSCERGAMCFDVDPDTGIGRCEAFCRGSESSPVCADPDNHCVGRYFSLCLPNCCPLEQDCDEGEGCYPVGDGFECAPDVSGEMGSFGDPCEFINVCNVGLFCADAILVPGCDGSTGCCTSWCELDSYACQMIDPALECVPWFEPGHALPGLEPLGGCLLPE